MPDNTRARTRRLRKKLHVGEFQVMGFEVTISVRATLTIEQHNDFWERFIREAIEGNGLLYGGLEEGYATSEHGSATDTDRNHVQTWLMQQPEVANFEIHQLSDAYSATGTLLQLLPVAIFPPPVARKHWAKFRRTAF